MRYITVLVFAVNLLFSVSAIAQINPDGRFGILLNFESGAWAVGGDSSVVTISGDIDTMVVFSFVPIFEKVANPVDSIDHVGKITTNDGTTPFVFIDNEFILDFSVRNQIQVDVYSPAVGSKVQVVIEKFDDFNINIPVVATTTVANEWETLTFDFSGAAPNTYGKIVLYMDYQGTNVGDVWYFDNVRKTQPPISYDDGIIADFETKNPYLFSFAGENGNNVADYEGKGMTVIENPDPWGINTSETVASFITTDQLEYDGVAAVDSFVPFDFSEGTVFKVKVYSNTIGLNFLFQLEHSDGTVPLGRVFDVVTTTKVWEWEELTFDFAEVLKSEEPGFYSTFVLMPDVWGTTDGEEWLFDDILFVRNTTSISNSTPTEYKLYAENYPNPFNPSTIISYSIPTNSKVQLAVYNLLGKEVANLVNEEKVAGSYTINFDGSDLSSGIYFYILDTGTEVISKKMLLVK